MLLSQLTNGESGVITKVRGRGAFRRRITEMGFVKGKKVTVIKNAPLKDPVEYKIMSYKISLRKSEARLIEVITKEEAKKISPEISHGVITKEVLKKSAKVIGKTINVALVGNPNSGKTTFFNFATKSREKVANYSGVTIDSKTAVLKYKGYIINVVDLPGTYSLTAYSPEELYVRNYIINNTPDVIINIVDASNLERNLYLTTQLIDMDVKVIIALNMYDELIESGNEFDHKALGKMIGIPFVPTISNKGTGIPELFEKVIKVYTEKDKTHRHIHINYGHEIEESISKLQDLVWHDNNIEITNKYSSRFLAIKLLEQDNNAHKVLENCVNYDEIKKTTITESKRLETLTGEDCETLITDAKYGFIAGSLKETFKKGYETKRGKTEKIDGLLTHKLFGLPIFFLFMWIMFQGTFNLGQYPMHWIENGVSRLGRFIENIMADGVLKDLLINGLIDGVGGVLVFLPNILILFLFISIMEDTGYMARVAFIMDKVMHRIGLHGRSFIPLIMGFGCNVPAIMATRTIENRNNRLVTILINPFMSCSARLPVYVLFIGAFFPERPGTVLFGIYVAGISLGAILAVILKKTFFKGKESPFVMELPPYRIPTVRAIIKHMWDRAGQYLKKIGGVILVASIIIWALGYYPKTTDYSKDYAKLINNISLQYDYKVAESDNSDSLSISLFEKEKNKEIQKLLLEKKGEEQENSFLGRLGRIIEPAIKPLGFDWKMGISLVSGLAAKELVVSTLAVLYHTDPGHAEGHDTLTEKLKEQRYQSGPKMGEPIFNPIVAMSFLLFILIYFPCIGVIATIKNETGSWNWALFTVFYTTILAWLTAFTFYQVANLVL